MFDFKSLFAEWREPNAKDSEEERAVELAAAVLLMELAKADGHIDRVETVRIEAMLSDLFGVESQQAADLAAEARAEAQEAISLQPYTKQLNELLDAQQKRELLLALWHVAHSDGQVDGREEYTIRKICGLLNLRHRDFIQAKLKSL